MRKRKLWISAAVLLMALLIIIVIYRRAIAPPEAARLLPGSDSILYVDLKPFRLVSNFGKEPVVHEPEYEEFIRETGFQFERDLDEVAAAVHPPEPAGAPLLERRFSEIFIGRFNSNKLANYLRKLSNSVSRYDNTDIFQIPHEGRTVRVAILSVDTVAVSNAADAAHIEGIVKRYHRIASPFGGPALLRRHYKYVPLGSSAWAILKLDSPDGNGTSLPLPGGIQFNLPRDTVTVGSLRYTGSIQLRLEAFTPSEAEAKQLAGSVSTFLNLFRSIAENSQLRGPDTDVKTFFDSIKVEEHDERAVVTAQLPQGFIKKLLTEAPLSQAAEPPQKSPGAAPVEKKPSRKSKP